MNPLDSFTVERLEDLKKSLSVIGAITLGVDEGIALLEIALAAKQAKPCYWEIAGQLFSTKEEALKPGYRGTPEPLYEEASLPKLPDGWVLVPKEPTDQMVMAAMCSDDVSFGSDKDEEFFVEHRNIYAAMLAAAPKPDHIVGVTEKVSDEWIKCSERLPEGKGDVQLFCSDTREQLVGFHKGKGIFQFFSMNDVDGVCEPTHWMPLPAAPKPE